MAPPILDRALQILARREHSEAEVKRKLGLKGYASQEIHSTLKALKEMNYLSDERFARVYLKSLIQLRYGARRIQVKFREKGLPWQEALYREILSEIDVSPETQITHWIEKKSRLFKTDEPREKKYRKLLSFLLGKGFGFEESKKAVVKALR
jgi:regulatory protein